MDFFRVPCWKRLLLFILCNWLTAHHAAAASLRIGNSFIASTLGVDSDALPPDSNGAIGPTNYVEFINGRFSVFDKTSGSRVQTVSDRDFWINAGITLPANLDVSDARVLFDPGSQRWFASQVDIDHFNQVTNRFLLAVSSSTDPTQRWFGFAFRA